MDTIELRLLFVLGLLSLGGRAILASALLSSLAERLHSRRSAADASTRGARAARRVVLRHAGR
jgi:hypothetical protein